MLQKLLFFCCKLKDRSLNSPFSAGRRTPGNFLQHSFLARVRVLRGPGTQGPAPKLKLAN